MTAPLPWLAPYRDTPFDGEVLVPGSKSLTNRVLILAALADGPSVLTRPLGSRDTTLMLGALTTLGATIERDGVTWTITPSAWDRSEPSRHRLRPRRHRHALRPAARGPRRGTGDVRR